MEEHVRHRSERRHGRRWPLRLGRSLPPRHRPEPCGHRRRRSRRRLRDSRRRQSSSSRRGRGWHPRRRCAGRLVGQSALGLERRIDRLHDRSRQRPVRRHDGVAVAERSDDPPLSRRELDRRPARRPARRGPSLLRRRGRDPPLASAGGLRRLVATAPRRHKGRQRSGARSNRPPRHL